MRGTYMDHITRHMGVLSSRVIANSIIGRVNIDVDTEMTMCKLVNELEGWGLKSLNEGKANYPGIDLADWKKRIAVQITATANGRKINHTLKEFFDNKLDKSFDRLIVLIINNKNCPTATAQTKGDFHFDPDQDIWNLNTIVEKVKVLDIDVLKKISEDLNKELGFLPIGPRYPLPRVPRASDVFLEGSRDRELAKLESMVGTDRPVFLWGVGGIGKTEVAIQLAKRIAPEGNAYFLNYCNLPGDSEKEAMRETILQANFAGYSFRGEDNEARDAEFKARMDMLRTEYKDALLIIDNFDRDDRTLANLKNEPAYKELTAMGLKLIFTTRNQVKDGCEIKPLEEDQLLELMKQQLESVDVEEKDLREMIQAVDGHTLMVLLMAKTLEESWGDVTPEQILESLHKSELDQKDFPEVVSDQNFEQKQIYAHVKALFDVSGLGETDSSVLRCATLLPEDGMSDTLFKAALPKEQHQALRNLVSRGWIRREMSLLTIHPLIRDVCREELKPRDRDCKEFLNTLYRQYKPEAYDVSQIWQMASCFSAASDHLKDFYGDWSYDAARLWSEIGQGHVALRYALVSVNRREKCSGRFKVSRLASAYNMAANACNHLGEYEKAKEYGEIALKLRKKTLPKDDPKIAASYNNLGTTYSHLGNYRKALDYLWIAVRMREAQEHPKEEEIASTYNNIGTVYNSMGTACGSTGNTKKAEECWEKALKYRSKALEIRQRIFANNPTDPDLITSINNVGRTLHELGRYEDALEKEQEALARRKKTLHKTDSDLANSYYNVGHTFGAMEKYPEAIQHLEQALYTWELGEAEDNMYYASTKEELEHYRKQLSLQGV